MSVRIHHIANNLESVYLPATGAATPFGLPAPFPLSCTWAIYIDPTAPDDYMSQFTFGPNPFTNHDYYQAAMRVSSATGSADTTWNLGFEGDHPSSAPWTTITRGRWFYQGFRADKITNANNNVQIEYYWDLPDIGAFIDVHDLLGFTYDFVVGASHSFRIGDNAWPTTAPNESLEGNIAGFKIWQAFLDVESLAAEAINPWPVRPEWAGYLWDVVPCRNNYDHTLYSPLKTNNRAWSFPNVAPSTSSNDPPAWEQTRWWRGDVWAPAAAAVTSDRQRTLEQYDWSLVTPTGFVRSPSIRLFPPVTAPPPATVLDRRTWAARVGSRGRA